MIMNNIHHPPTYLKKLQKLYNLADEKGLMKTKESIF